MKGNDGQDSHFCSRMWGKQMQNARWSVGEHTQVRWKIHAGALANTRRCVCEHRQERWNVPQGPRVLCQLCTYSLPFIHESFVNYS